jgi:hypothetical protein
MLEDGDGDVSVVYGGNSEAPACLFAFLPPNLIGGLQLFRHPV